MKKIQRKEAGMKDGEKDGMREGVRRRENRG